MRFNYALIYGATYVIISVTIYIIGLLLANHLIEYLGFMLLASTFLPLPADPYTFYISQFFNPVFLGVYGGLINTIAVLAEKYFLILLIKADKLKKFLIFFKGLTLTKFIKKNMFLSLIITGYSFIPFEPIRLVAVTHNYNNLKYGLATFIGRGLRYGTWGLIGIYLVRFNILTYFIIVAFVLFILYAYRTYINRKNKH